MSHNPEEAYNDLPLLPPKADLETKQILKLAIEANKALAELNFASKMLPDPTVLINTIPLQEAKASSEIENIVTTSDELFRASFSDSGSMDPAVKETLRYRQALKAGCEMLSHRPITTNLICEICSIIKNAEMNIRKVPGTQIKNMTTGDVLYTPPEGERVIRDLLSDWEKFLNENNEYDPLIKLAVLHYQFEAIHPFIDGNGRTGRILNMLYLIYERLLAYPVLYVSGYIIKHKADYYRLIREVTANGNWEDWIIYILQGVKEASLDTVRRTESISALMKQTYEDIKRLTPNIPAKEMSEIIFTQPYCRVRNLVDSGVAKRQTAMLYLKALKDAGILESVKSGREVLFVNRRFLDILTA
ncbi:MAG TPA: addiction module protein [Deferribacteraceae bacterium]|nr:addiction module protein [Deferribacteraceae bacterium]